MSDKLLADVEAEYRSVGELIRAGSRGADPVELAAWKRVLHRLSKQRQRLREDAESPWQSPYATEPDSPAALPPS